MGRHQSKKLCTAKQMIKTKKRQHTEWVKIFANHTCDKELISRLYKNSYNSTVIKTCK